MLFYWPKLLYPYYSLLLFFPSLLSVYRLKLWGVYHSLSALHCRHFLIIIIILQLSFSIFDDHFTEKINVFCGQELPSRESTTTECGVNYQRLAVIY